MKRITSWLLSTATVLVLLFSYRTSTDSGVAVAATSPPSVSTPSSPTTTGTTAAGRSTTASDPTTTAGGTAPTTGTTTAPTTTAAGGSGVSGTFTGEAADTRYGPVQVQITVVDGRITAATAVDYPQRDHRDQEINAYAIPVLEQETVAAQSAQIDLVSGATYTSDGYQQSLQSALDQAQR